MSPDDICHGLDFILSHFQEPAFPRKIMTKDLGYQVEIFNKQNGLDHFKRSRFEDCRINAYPPFTEFNGINRTPISFLVIDLDLRDFANLKVKLDRAVNKTLRKIEEIISGVPTVLWTGNGYHIYQPVSGIILEETEIFYEFTKNVNKDLTSLFIQFSEEYFTESTADRLHNPTVKSCLLRIPGSLNSKSIANKSKDPKVKIIQRWLIQKRINDVAELKKQEKKHSKFQIINSQNQEHKNRINTIKWIENGILENPLSDHRKYIIWRILSPYLLNVKSLPKEESYSVIKNWLDKCDKLEILNFNAKIKIKEGLKGASKGYFPISLEKLKEENKELYDIVVRAGKRISENT